MPESWISLFYYDLWQDQNIAGEQNKTFFFFFNSTSH